MIPLTDAPLCPKSVTAILLLAGIAKTASGLSHLGEGSRAGSSSLSGDPLPGGPLRFVPLPKWYRDTASQLGKRTWNPQRCGGWGGLSGEVGGKCRKPGEKGSLLPATAHMAQFAGPRSGLRQSLHRVAERHPSSVPQAWEVPAAQLWDQPPPCLCWTLGQHVGAIAVNLSQGETTPTPTSLGFLIPTAVPDG